MENNENKSTEWLESQMMTIPVEEFIKMRLQMAEQGHKEDRLYHRLWDTEKECDELKAALEDAKKQIKELLGINEAEKEGSK